LFGRAFRGAVEATLHVAQWDRCAVVAMTGSSSEDERLPSRGRRASVE
jgi:hypothetical protein